MYELGPDNGRLTIHTTRAGVAARAGHDLVIEAGRWRATLSGEPLQLQAEIDATSLLVRDGTGGVKPLTDSDREEIGKNIEQKVLNTGQHPTISFASTGGRMLDEHRWQVDGNLTLAGTTVPVQVPVEVEPDPDGIRLRATVTVVQSRFGIKPYTAMMGALKVADEVEIRAEATAPASR